MSFALTIAGVTKTIQPGWSIDETANGRNVLNFDVKSADGSYRPALDDEVIFTDSGTRIFGGNITRPTEAGWLSLGVTPITTTVQASDFNALVDRRYITATIPSGSLKAALQIVVPYIPGATLDAAQVTGPSLPELVYADVKVRDVLEDLTIQSGGYLWEVDYTKVARMLAPGSVAAPANVIQGGSCIAIGDITVEPTRQGYANRVIVRTATLRSQADDAGEQATHGLWEALYTAPDTTPQAGCDALAAMILARSIVVLKKVVYETETRGIHPAQTQTITAAKRNLSNTFLITDTHLFAPGPDVLRTRVTAIEGLVYQTGWQETWRKLFSGGNTIGGASGGTGGVTLTRFAYFLGGSGVDATQSPTPTWVPASGGNTTLGKGAIQVQINTIPRGTLAALVTCRLRALDAGVSVRARLYDVSASSACPGTSSVVTNTDWVTVSFAVTLTAGSHLYELQLLPGTANADVIGTGYLE